MMKSMGDQQRVYFHNLDVLRFMAAYVIVIFHAFFGWKANYGYPSFMLNEQGQLSGFGKFFENFIHNLSFGVDIFFLISGFLITYLLLSEKEETGKVDIKKFYIRRAFRIWPLYFLILLTGPLLTFFFNEKAPGNYLYHLVFLGNFELIKNGFSSAAVNHLWSICVEEHFYLISPIIIALIPQRKLPFVFMSIIFISMLFRGIVVGTENYWMNIYLNTLSRIDTLAIGSLFGYLYYHKKVQFNDSAGVRWLVYLVFIYLYVSDDIFYWDNIFLAAAKKYFYVIIAAYAIGNYLFNREPVFSVPKETNLHYYGKLSYSIYMFNPIIIAVIIKLFHIHHVKENLILYLIFIHTSLHIICSFSYHYLEMPFLKLKERFAVIKSGRKLEKETVNTVPPMATANDE